MNFTFTMADAKDDSNKEVFYEFNSDNIMEVLEKVRTFLVSCGFECPPGELVFDNSACGQEQEHEWILDKRADQELPQSIFPRPNNKAWSWTVDQMTKNYTLKDIDPSSKIADPYEDYNHEYYKYDYNYEEYKPGAP